MIKRAASIVDEVTGERVDARVQVPASTGRLVHPGHAILKMGPGAQPFYSDGSLGVDVPRGKTQVGSSNTPRTNTRWECSRSSRRPTYQEVVNLFRQGQEVCRS